MGEKDLAPASTVPASREPTAFPGARLALSLLIAINLFNYIDRQVLAAVVPEIKTSLQLDDNPYGNTWMGLLTSAFMVSYMLTAPLFGWLAGRFPRWRLLAIGIIWWTLASGASGLDWPGGAAVAFWLLLLTRALVGVGEAAYGPVAPAIISDLYPVRRRGSVLAWFYMAIPVGCALGYALGGQIKGTILGWRWAFFLVVPPGILLGLSCLAMRDPPRGQADPGAEATTRPPRWRDYLDLLYIPSYTLNTLGMTALAFALGGLAAWVPVYLEIRKKAGEVTDVGMDGVTFFGILVAGCGLIATLAGGLAGDALRGRFPGSYFLVSGISMLLAFPLLLLILVTAFPLAWLWLGLAVFFLFFNTGPTNTILANVSHPAVRAVAFGLNILIIHLLGDAISPFIIGFIYDISSLNAGFAFVSLLVLVGGVLWLWGARYLERDTHLAPTRLDHERITIPAPAGQTMSPGA